MLLALVMLVQVAPDTPERFSILTPACTPGDHRTDEVVVCGAAQGSVRLPLPDERAAVGPLPLNPALMVDPSPRPVGATPCAARLAGCQVGFGPPLIPMIKGAVGLAKSAFAKKPDKTGRVAIDLGDPAP